LPKATLCYRHIAEYDARFGKPPVGEKGLHWPLSARDDLEDAFAWREERTSSQALTLQYDKMMFTLEPSGQKAAIGQRVIVFDYPDGRLSIRHHGVELAYRTFEEIRQVDQGAIADDKHLEAVFAILEMNSCTAGPSVAVFRTGATNAMPRLFKVG
jgi:hypothetical protein